MLRLALVASALFVSTYADCAFPNGTDTKLNWWQGATTAKVTFTKLVPVDDAGNSIYPIHLNKALNVMLHFDNEQGEFSNTLVESIKLYQYGGFAGCSWSEVPTFGLLENLEACSHGIPCPIKTGDQDLKIVLDFTMFSQIIALLKNDSPYQIELKMKDKSTGLYFTVIAQGRCETKA